MTARRTRTAPIAAPRAATEPGSNRRRVTASHTGCRARAIARRPPLRPVHADTGATQAPVPRRHNPGAPERRDRGSAVPANQTNQTSQAATTRCLSTSSRRFPPRPDGHPARQARRTTVHCPTTTHSSPTALVNRPGDHRTQTAETHPDRRCTRANLLPQAPLPAA